MKKARFLVILLFYITAVLLYRSLNAFLPHSMPLPVQLARQKITGAVFKRLLIT